MKTCQYCRYGDRAVDGDGTVFFWCRLFPPGANGIPSMKPIGWCGQFKLATFRWLKSFVVRGT